MIDIKNPFIVVNTKETSLVFEIKEYKDDRTPFNKGKYYITQRYYGKSIDVSSLEVSEPKVCPHGSCDDYNQDSFITSFYGDGNNKEPSILLENSDGTYVNRFFFKDAKVIKGAIEVRGPHARNVKETLEIVEADEPLNLELHTYYSVLEDSDVIVVKRELVNNSNKELHIKRLYSLETPVNTTKVKVYTFDGAWLYERSRHESVLTNGLFTNGSVLGSSSHKHNPFIEIHDEVNDAWYAYNLIYSGNHKELVDVYPLGKARVMTGINDFAFDYLLKAGESFVTPEAIMLVKSSLDEITSEMHHFALNHIVNPDFVNKPRPIIFNNWEGTGMNINETSLLEMAVIAKRVGVEQFVMDDGWFNGRVNDLHALGDWFVDLNKFPNGLKPFVDQVKAMGLKFGIWVEPEMISIDSDIYRAHPEYASIIPGREPIERRHQLMIDMSNPEVVDYLYNSLIKVFDEITPDYIKWDYNRNMIDNYSLVTRNGEFAYRFIYGTYDLMNRLVERYPNMLMESCSSGGGRFDLGMLYYMPQTWGSDDTHTACRTFITCGTLTAYPQSSFGAHVSRDGSCMPNKLQASLEDRFNLNAIGAFGYEFDFRKFPESDLDIMTNQVKYYKEHRGLLQYGEYYVIDNIFDDERYFSFNVVSKDQEKAMLVIIDQMGDSPAKPWKVKGLNPSYTYQVSMRPQYNLLDSQLLNKVCSGEELMEKGLDIGKLNTTTDAEDFKTGVFSRMIYIKRIK